jgi:hypothetical protein
MPSTDDDIERFGAREDNEHITNLTYPFLRLCLNNSPNPGDRALNF